MTDNSKYFSRRKLITSALALGVVGHYPPSVHMELYRPVFNQYINRYPPNLFESYQPQNTSDAFQYLSDKSVWQ